MIGNGKISGWSSCVLALALVAGCEPIDRGGSKDSDKKDDFDLSKVTWYGPIYSESARDERAVLHSAEIDLNANVVRLSYDPLPADWPKQVNAPGMLNLFEELEDGTWKGGKFEWLDPGQTVKLLNNIDNGYNGWQRPAIGSRVAIIIFSTDGRFHSNPAYSVYE